jgi:hypothetical protein
MSKLPQRHTRISLQIFSDTLRKVYYHLFNNAFQPGSEMDARLHTIKDPDARMVNKVMVDKRS